MDKTTLKRIVVETLGFDPDEFAYKLREHESDLEEIKNILRSTLPVIGTTILEGQLIKEYLKSKGLDPEEFVNLGVKQFNESKQELINQATTENKKIKKPKIKKDTLLHLPASKEIQ